MRTGLFFTALAAIGAGAWALLGHSAHATSCGCIGDYLELGLAESTCEDCAELPAEATMFRNETGIHLVLGDYTLDLQELQ